jgi:hypothetical protein
MLKVRSTTLLHIVISAVTLDGGCMRNSFDRLKIQPIVILMLMDNIYFLLVKTK